MKFHCIFCGKPIEAPGWTHGPVKCATCGEEFDPGRMRTEPLGEEEIARLSPSISEIIEGKATEPEERKTPVLEPGTWIGPYRIERLIGKGGMGAVYLATHVHLERRVALKVLPENLAKDPEFVQRFRREAVALARLQHPNIVAVHDMGVEAGRHYIAMEFVDGVNLRHLLNQHMLSPQEALSIVPKLCGALEYAHSQGVIHRDIKPENILIARDGTPKIADFGLAKIVRGDAPRPGLTATNVVMGTADYMAPEQRQRTAAVDHRADIYALGVVIYEMLTGELPVGRFPPPSKRVKVDVRLDRVVLRALEHDPQLRYQRASELAEEVTRITSGAPGPQGRLDFGRCLNEAITVWQKNWLILACAVVVAYALMIVTLGILAGAMAGGFALLCLRALRRPDRRVELGDLFAVVGRFLPLLLLLIVTNLMNITIVLGPFVLFAMLFAVDQRRGITDSVRDSWRAAKEIGYGTAFLFYGLVVLLTFGPQAVGSALPLIGPCLAVPVILIVMPVVMLLTAAAYMQVAERPALGEPATPQERTRTVVWIVVGLLAGTVLLVLCCLASAALSLVRKAPRFHFRWSGPDGGSEVFPEAQGMQERGRGGDEEPLAPNAAEDASALIGKARQCEQEGNISEAIDLLTRAIERDPNNPEPYLLRARARDATGDWQGALEDYRAFLARAPQEDGKVLEVRGRIEQLESERRP
jgi:predicted Ser/Thr protein kinase